MGSEPSLHNIQSVQHLSVCLEPVGVKSVKSGGVWAQTPDHSAQHILLFVGNFELVELVFQLVDPSVFDDELAAQQLQLLTLGCVGSTELWEQDNQYYKVISYHHMHISIGK